MSFLVDCIEPQGRPPKRTVDVEADTDAGLFLLPPSPDASLGLRRLVFRQKGEEPPVGSRLVLVIRTDGSKLHITEVGPGLEVELIRRDLRSAAYSGMRLPATAMMELSLPDRSRVAFTLSVRELLAQGAKAGVAGGGTRKSRVVYGSDNVFWLITDSKGIAVTFLLDIWDRTRDRLLKMGIDSRVLTFATGLLIAGLIGGFAAWNRHRAAVAASDRAETAEASAALSQAAREASLATELVCLEQRKELAEQLGDKTETQALGAEQALSFPLAQAVSLEHGGEAMATDALLRHDGMYRHIVVDAVIQRLGKSSGDVSGCLQQDAALASDLPAYLLLYHPNPDLTCPPDYEAVDGGVQQIGQWGLSRRVAREFGDGGDRGLGADAEVVEGLVGDPRLEPRWAAFTVASALRDIQTTLLRFDGGARVAVMPSQAQLWSLAFLDAYNRMPTPANGTLDVTAKECVVGVLEDRLKNAPPAMPGEPLLPDIVSVALGDGAVVARPTPGCPWPRNALVIGADASLHAASRLANHYVTTGTPAESP